MPGDISRAYRSRLSTLISDKVLGPLGLGIDANRYYYAEEKGTTISQFALIIESLQGPSASTKFLNGGTNIARDLFISLTLQPISILTTASPSPAITTRGLSNVLPSIETDKAISDTGSNFVNNSNNNNYLLLRGKKQRNRSSATYEYLVSSSKLKR